MKELRDTAGAGGSSCRVDYLRVSVTDRCNHRCRYCMPPGGVEFRDHGEILSYEEIAVFTRVAAGAGITRVRVTGGEPLARRQCPELIARLAEVPGIEDLSLTTNGSLLEAHARQLREAGLSRINISIPSLSPRRFESITGAALQPVLDGLRAAMGAGFEPVKVNAVMLDGIEGELESYVALADEMPVHVRFIEHMPVGCRVDGWKFIPRSRLLARLKGLVDLVPAPSPVGAGPARYFRFDGARGTIGFISAMSDSFCGSCNRLRLTAGGRLRNCLFSDEEVDVRPLISGDEGELRRVIVKSMLSKRCDRLQEGRGPRTMSQVGG